MLLKILYVVVALGTMIRGGVSFSEVVRPIVCAFVPIRFDLFCC